MTFKLTIMVGKMNKGNNKQSKKLIVERIQLHSTLENT